MDPLPRQLIERARAAKTILEVGAGDRFEVALALQAAAPGARIVVTDVHERVLQAPPTLVAGILDVTQSELRDVERADLIVAVRLPEELQLATAKLARSLDADLALRPLKDEWADVSEHFRRFVVWPGGWRYYPR